MRNLPFLSAVSAAALSAHAPRAVMMAPRANSISAAELARQLNDGFEDFKARHNDRLSTLENAFSAQASTLAALRMGGGADLENSMQNRERGLGLSADVRREVLAQMLGRPSAARQMESGSNPDGGYTISPELDKSILPLLRTLPPLRRWATVATISSGHSSWQKIITLVGGKSAWVGELDERAETDTPALGRVEIVPEELMAMPSLTNQVLEDSAFDLEQFLMDDLVSEMNLQEGNAFVSGNGVKKPRGYLTLPTATTGDASRAFGTLQHVLSGNSGAIVDTDLLNLLTPLRAVYRAGPGVGWIMNSTTEGYVRSLKDGQGRFIWQQGLEMGAPNMLLGYPVGIDESMPDVAANAFPIAFGNWRRGYAIVDRIGMKLIRDNVTRKGWTKLYFYRRVGGAPLDTNAIKLLKIKP
ncbi:MAG: phage major capsid protein [Sphingomonas sp.]|nr:phage major capsid protein [Sphingomonas sp.]